MSCLRKIILLDYASALELRCLGVDGAPGALQYGQGGVAFTFDGAHVFAVDAFIGGHVLKYDVATGAFDSYWTVDISDYYGHYPTDVVALHDGGIVVSFVGGHVVHVAADGSVCGRLMDVGDRIMALALCDDDVFCKTLTSGIVVLRSEWPKRTRCTWVTACTASV